MTSLSQQLKKLAAPQTQIYKQDKKRASFLFDPKEAASIDRETFFDLGCSGLDELQLLDEKFAQFKDVLFSESAAEIQRSMLTKQANDGLDVSLNKFILHVTPYFTLKSAHKALEWLIYRFYIHQYNVDSVILCILPYHDSNLFVRMLQILEISESNPTWYWLTKARKFAHPLPRQMLLNHCAADLGFLNQICGTVSKLVENFFKESSENDLQRLHVIFTFYSSLVCGTIGSTDKINDSFVGQLIPHIILGIKSRISDYSISSFMIVCQLALKLKLASSVNEFLIKQMLLKMRRKTVAHSVATIVVLFQTQAIAEISSRALIKLSKNEIENDFEVLAALERLDAKTNLEKFLCVLIRCSIEFASTPAPENAVVVSFLCKIVSELKLAPTVVEVAMECLIDNFFARFNATNKSISMEAFKSQFSECCSGLFKRHPAVLDAISQRRHGENDEALHAFMDICDPNFHDNLIRKFTKLNDPIPPEKMGRKKKVQTDPIAPLTLHSLTSSQISFGPDTKILAKLDELSDPMDVLQLCADNLEEFVSSAMPEKLDADCLNFHAKLISKFDEETSEFLTLHSRLYTVFKKLVSFDVDHSWYSGLSMATLQQISSEFFEHLPCEVRYDLLKKLFEMKLACPLNLSANVGAQIKFVLSTVSMDSAMLMKFLKESIFVQGAIASPKKALKRKRTESGTSVDATDATPTLNAQQLKLLSEFMECFASNENAEKSEVFLPMFFTSLAVYMSLEKNEISEYRIRMALICIESIFSTSKNSKINSKNFDVEMLVRCIRFVKMPQSHQHAFNLLAIAADLFKEELIVRLMPIFSFMGDNLFRQDDWYSFQIIERTIETVIPSLLKAYADKNERWKVLTKIFRDFVSSSMHIPQHRRFSVLKTLVESSTERTKCDAENLHNFNHQPDAEMRGQTDEGLNAPHENLWMLIGLLIEYHVMNWTNQGRAGPSVGDPVCDFIQGRIDLRETDLNSALEFAAGLCSKFHAADQILSATNLMKYILILPDELRPAAVSWTENSMAQVFDLKGKTDKQLVHFKYELLGFVSHQLTNADFLAKLCDLSEEEFDKSSVFFENLAEEIMHVSNHYARLAQTKINDASAKVWKAMLHRAKACFDKFNILLPAGVSLNVIDLLLRRSESTVKQCALDILNAKLIQNPTPFTKQQIPKLCSISKNIASWLKNDALNSHEQILLMQGALYTLKLLVRVTCSHEKQPFLETLEKVVALCHNWRCANKALLCNAVLCLADLVVGLNLQTLPLLPTFVNDLLGILADESFLIDNELLVISCLTALQKIVEAMPKFLNPYLQDIFETVGAKYAEDFSSSQNKNDVTHRCLSIRKRLSDLPLRVLLPAAENCMKQQSKSTTFLPFLFDVMSDTLQHTSSDDVTDMTDELTGMFFIALDFRTQREFSKDIEQIEDKILNAFSILALKMSENLFKPIIAQLIEWATFGLSGDEVENRDRLITLVKLAIKLADKLKSLFGLFAPPFIKLASELVPKAIKSENPDTSIFVKKWAHEKSDTLLCDLFDLITKCCQYDAQNLITRQRFDLLYKPLVEQLENTAVKNYAARVTEHLTPCVVNLAQAVGDDSAWKVLNYEILMKTRNKKSKIRVLALKIIEQLYTKLGESMSTLIPESVPFLAELMEDENEEVEQQCQKVIGALETIVGESLKDYF